MTRSLIFFGSDQYSAIVLSSLLKSGVYHLISVVTDHHSDNTPVEKLAIKHNLKVSYYPSIPATLSKNTIGLCSSFDHLLSSEIIDRFAGNLYNLHPSLLPQYRNVSPVQYAIALGDKVTGITLFRIAPTIDDGEIISQVSEPILPNDTTPTLTSRLFAKGADLFLEHLITPRVKGAPHSRSVVPLGVPLIFTHRLTRDSGYLEWPVLHALLTNQPISPTDTQNELLHLQPSPSLDHLLRALTPWPGVWSLVPQPKADPPRADTRITLISHSRSVIPDILISGHPAPILYNDFIKYYLGK